MAIVAKTSRPTTLGQRFRLLTEALLMEAAQKAMLRQYPNTGASPYPKTGPIYALSRFLFLPGFRLTPWPLRRRMMRLFLLRRIPPWPAQASARKGGDRP